MIDPAPIQGHVVEQDRRLSRVWTLWFGKLVARANEGDGVSGSFTTVDSKTVTVVNGIITDIT